MLKLGTPLTAVVVEVDGGVHRSSVAADRRRDEKLQRLGYRVVCVPAALVVRHVGAALEVVRCALRALGLAPPCRGSFHF
jgi:very-short-patch-repair endonuclease